MKMTKLALAALGTTLTLAGAAKAESHGECGAISIAEWNWASGELMANVDKIILEEGYGCEVTLVPGATTTTFASMNEKAQPDVAGELWINAVRDQLDNAIAEGRLHSVLDGPITELGEGWWVTPKFAADHPELNTVEKVLEHPELFPNAEDESKGAFIGCPAGWGCQLVNANLFRAFDMEEKGWVLVDPGSAAGLDGSMAKAVERDQNWFGYYWSPTAMIGKYEMVLLPFEAEYAGDDNWNGCIALAEQDCADPKPTAWTKSEVHTVITDEFKKKGGPAVDYLSKRIFPGAIMNGMLVYMQDEQAGGEDAAFEFLEKHGDIWESWVSPEVAEKVKSAL